MSARIETSLIAIIQNFINMHYRFRSNAETPINSLQSNKCFIKHNCESQGGTYIQACDQLETKILENMTTPQDTAPALNKNIYQHIKIYILYCKNTLSCKN